MDYEITLERFAHFDTCVLGKMYLPNEAEIFTIERPWLNNKPFKSCIPSGTYELEWDTTGRVKYVPRLCDVPGRSQINIHAANYASQLHGCIAPGMTWHHNDGLFYVEDSADAMALLMESLGLRMIDIDDDGNEVWVSETYIDRGFNGRLRDRLGLETTLEILSYNVPSA